MTQWLVHLLNRIFLLILFSFSLSFGFYMPEEGDLVIEVDNIQQAGGVIWVGIYDSEANFMVKEKAIVEGFDVKNPGTLTMNFPQLPFGNYAIALFHDINNNGVLDRNLIGIPSEPFAFSKPPRSKWRLPRFEEVEFYFNRNGQVLKTHLNKWWDQ